ncbi:MAG: hypothetical protein KY055_02100 [Candidatus Nealsonbacteria bacterium]|nr:hypothetical protein [Candidatus Nealsonbacteria bacterium]
MPWFFGDFEKCVEKNARAVWITMLGKGIGGIGLGILLVSYLPEHNWLLYGWMLILVSLILHIPIIKAVLKK